MRLPRLFPQRRDPHTAIITEVKSSVRTGDTQKIRKALLTRRSQVGLGLDTTMELSHILTGRVADTISHEEATERLEKMAGTLSSRTLPHRTWSTLENLARTVGCFSGSHSFSERLLEELNNSPDPAQRFLSAVHRRNRPDAESSWRAMAKIGHGSSEDFGHYLWLWSRGEDGAASWTTDPEWSRLIEGHRIVLVGPAPVSEGPPPQFEEALIGRVLMQEVLQWDQESDPYAGRCDLGWASRETRNWLRDHAAWDALAYLQAVSFRLNDVGGIPHIGESTLIRSARNPRKLMVGGSSPNMIPLMLWDVLGVQDVTVHLTGTTFFASPRAYSESNLRLKHSVGKRTDVRGSTGELFERCPTFARHNVTENLNLVANLVNSGSLSADGDCHKVTNWDVKTYLEQLDDLYGIERR